MYARIDLQYTKFIGFGIHFAFGHPQYYIIISFILWFMSSIPSHPIAFVFLSFVVSYAILYSFNCCILYYFCCLLIFSILISPYISHLSYPSYLIVPIIFLSCLSYSIPSYPIHISYPILSFLVLISLSYSILLFSFILSICLSLYPIFFHFSVYLSYPFSYSILSYLLIFLAYILSYLVLSLLVSLKENAISLEQICFLACIFPFGNSYVPLLSRVWVLRVTSMCIRFFESSGRSWISPNIVLTTSPSSYACSTLFSMMTTSICQGDGVSLFYVY